MTRLGVNKVLNSENIKQCIFVLSKHYIVARKGNFYSLFAPVPIVLSHVLFFLGVSSVTFSVRDLPLCNR